MSRNSVRFVPEGTTKQCVRNEIANRLRELIACGELRRGDKLPAERHLAEVLGVSRHSVREAIRSLEQQGVLASRRGDGTYVLDDRQELLYGPLGMAVEQRNIQEVLEFRKLLEPQIASLAARIFRAPILLCCGKNSTSRKPSLLRAVPDRRWTPNFTCLSPKPPVTACCMRCWCASTTLSAKAAISPCRPKNAATGR